MKSNKYKGLKVLLVDVETAPVIGYVWGLWENNLGLNQVKADWHLLSWSAKFLKGADGTVYGPHDKVMYMDQRGKKNIEDDKEILKHIWKLLDEADVVIGQNSNRFDIKKLNARFILNGMQPPSSFKKIDTMLIAKKYFAFTSNKLEYMTKNLCVKYKKLSHSKFAGFELWRQCLADNLDAWKEMEKYNKYDVLSLEELYLKLAAWDSAGVNFNLYNNSTDNVCKCGSDQFQRNGFFYTAQGKFQRYKCSKCGHETRDRKNLLTKDKKEFLKVGTSR